MTTNNKKVWLIVLVVLIIVAAIAISKGHLSSVNTSPVNKTASSTESNKPEKIVQVKSDQVPKLFPADFPLETDALILENNNTTLGADSIRAIRIFLSKKTLAENYKIYSDYFTSTGWTVGSNVNTDKEKAIAAGKANLTATVNMTQDPSGANVVSISLMTIPKLAN